MVASQPVPEIPRILPLQNPARYRQRGVKCGLREYVKVCGGSRSRAFALTGDYLAEDPRCIYQPHLADAVAG